MTDNVLPSNPINSRFGWPKPARIEEFKKLLATASGATTRVVFHFGAFEK
jgi:hypothetical protein